MPFLLSNQQHQSIEDTAKGVISSAKEKKQKECASDLNDPNHQITKQMVKERQDITGSDCLK